MRKRHGFIFLQNESIYSRVKFHYSKYEPLFLQKKEEIHRIHGNIWNTQTFHWRADRSILVMKTKYSQKIINWPLIDLLKTQIKNRFSINIVIFVILTYQIADMRSNDISFVRKLNETWGNVRLFYIHDKIVDMWTGFLFGHKNQFLSLLWSNGKIYTVLVSKFKFKKKSHLMVWW